MTLALSVVETAWDTITTPKTAVVASCLTGDYLFVLAGGDASASNAVTACTTSTTAGTTGGWTEPVENFTGTADDWFSSAWAQVTADGSVTVSVDRTKAGSTGGAWGYFVVRGRGSAGLGTFASTSVSGSPQSVSLAVSANSGVAFLSVDWNAAAVATAWTPVSGATLVERTALSDYTVHAAYWSAEAAGTRSYGSTGGTSSKYRCLALEIKEAAAAAASWSPRERGPNYRR